MDFRTGRLKNRFIVAVLAFFVWGIPLGCTEGKRKPDAGSPAGSEIFEHGDLTITRADGTSVKIRAELAKSNTQQEQGLMYRESLADGEGMLFVYANDRIMHFWMKNTRIDLSIAFIAGDGRIFEIRDMRKGDLSGVTSTRSARYALEVPRGWFTRERIRPGDRLVIEKW
ncbi:MAG: DUF192 domain-containing protein [Treponema sp.]|jgi:uncharacterized membrane protein (UPF0127 family)|nr:DUF192 domain-containing protein [Treponema sp.]